jgi:hypothetical protein
MMLNMILRALQMNSVQRVRKQSSRNEDDLHSWKRKPDSPWKAIQVDISDIRLWIIRGSQDGRTIKMSLTTFRAFPSLATTVTPFPFRVSVIVNEESRLEEREDDSLGAFHHRNSWVMILGRRYIIIILSHYRHHGGHHIFNVSWNFFLFLCPCFSLEWSKKLLLHWCIYTSRECDTN